MSTHPLLDFPATQYYFDTFIIGAHHSVPHMIVDLQRRLDIANNEMHSPNILSYRMKELIKIVAMIENRLAITDLNELHDLEIAEPVYWVNQLGRTSALEISTYGRIRPDTMNLLMCLPEDDFVTAMAIAGRLSSKIQIVGENSLISDTPLPISVPVVS